MKKFNLIFILALLLGSFIFPTRTLASTDPLNHVKNDLSQEELMNKDSKDVENKGKVLNFKEDKSKKLLMQNPVGGTQKTFTVTKRSLGSTEDGELVGEYDTLFGAFGVLKQNDQAYEYVITVNKDYDIPEDEAVWDRSDVNILLRSAQGNTYTLKRLGTRLIFYVSRNCKMKTENIILDGNKDGELTFISVNGELTLGKGTVVQNFIDVTSYDGPAIYLSGEGALNIEDGVAIKDNKSDLTDGYYAGVIYAAENSTVNIKGGEFTNNRSNEKSGGVIRSSSNAVVNISGGTFENNSAEKTGGVIQAYGKVNISGGTFKNNKASSGGAVYSSGELSISKTTFENNTAKWGGAIFASKKLTLNDVIFKNNKVNSAGGALYLQGGADIKDSTFTENSAGVSGGAIYCTNANLDIDGATFDNNKSEARGGALFLSGQNNYSIKNSTIKNNKAKDIGGGITALLGNLTVESSTIESNNSESLGGGLYIDADITANISDTSKFINNKSGMGGAIFDAALSYDNPADTTKYQNLNIDISTEFRGNIARANLYTPPINYDSFDKLKFSDASDIPHMKGMSKSLLNNYDINYKGDFLIIYDANGGKFEDGKTEKQETHKVNDEITIPAGPVREGFKFTGWRGTKLSADPASVNKVTLNPGNKFKLDGNYIFAAQWEKIESKVKDKGYLGTFTIKSPDEFKKKIGSHKAYLAGYPDKKVLAEGKMTRAEAVALISRLEGYDLSDSSSRIFSDLKEGSWYNKYINAAFEKGILVEKSGQDFRPDSPITRAEFAKLIEFIDKKNNSTSPFADVKGHIYEDAINQAYGNNRIAGYPDGTFRPDAPITRAEIVTILNNFYDRKADAKSLEGIENLGLLKHFTDLNENHWAYYEIMEAANSHEYIRRNENGIVENWIRLIEDMVK